MQQITATLTNVRHSPFKMRVIAREVSKMQLQDAQRQLKLSQKKAASYILKTLNSAAANAVNNHSASMNDLYIESIQIGEGMRYNRPNYRARGRLNIIKSRFSHVRVALGVKQKEENGSKN